MKILALTKYSKEGASSRYRYYNYQEAFAKEGWSMTISPLLNRHYLNASNLLFKGLMALWGYLKRWVQVCGVLLSPHRYDLVLIEYELFPYTPAWFERAFRTRGVRYVVGYDDAIFHRYEGHWFLRGKIAKVMEHASAVVVCNRYLEEYANGYHSKIFRLPTVVSLEAYGHYHARLSLLEKEYVVVGWIGSKTTSSYLIDLLPVMERLYRFYPKIIFHLVGFDDALLSKEQKALPYIRLIEWEEAREIGDIVAFDVGVMPLRDDSWSRGKCAFKLIQYMSASKPVVASPVGMNRALIRSGVEGYLVHDDQEWFEALARLYRDQSLRESMGKKGFEKILHAYNDRIHSQRYCAFIKEIGGV
jgi:glycosyltransferase involved in cell wall biosynthesis